MCIYLIKLFKFTYIENNVDTNSPRGVARLSMPASQGKRMADPEKAGDPGSNPGGGTKDNFSYQFYCFFYIFYSNIFIWCVSSRIPICYAYSRDTR